MLYLKPLDFVPNSKLFNTDTCFCHHLVHVTLRYQMTDQSVKQFRIVNYAYLKFKTPNINFTFNQRKDFQAYLKNYSEKLSITLDTQILSQRKLQTYNPNVHLILPRTLQVLLRNTDIAINCDTIKNEYNIRSNNTLV